MPKYYYFQAPNFDIHPDSPSAPRLGSIFSKSALNNRLTGPLNQHDRLSIPDSQINTPDPVIPFSEIISKSLAVTLGLSAKAILLGGEGNILYHFSRNKTVTYRAQEMATTYFEPTGQYVRDSVVASQEVQRFLDESLAGRRKVYMVTGLKIATGFSEVRAVRTRHGPEVGVSLDVGAAAAGLATGLEAGPEGRLEVGRERVLAQGGGMSSRNRVVFAYRVVVVTRKRDGEVGFDWKSGGRYGVDDGEDEEEDEEDGVNKNECLIADIDDEILDAEGPEGFVGEPPVSAEV